MYRSAMSKKKNKTTRKGRAALDLRASMSVHHDVIVQYEALNKTPFGEQAACSLVSDR